MHSLDLEVVTQLHTWLAQGRRAWLCTVIRTFGSSPRPVGSLLATDELHHVSGSLSGGCVEDDLLARLWQGEFDGPPQRVLYGKTPEEAEKFGLPCGGHLEVMVQCFAPDHAHTLARVCEWLAGRKCVERTVDLSSGETGWRVVEQFRPLAFTGDVLVQTLGPAFLLLLVGGGPVSEYLAQMALLMDYRVLVCDPRPDVLSQWQVSGVECIGGMPDDIVRQQVRDSRTAVITLTHDPRIDDMALMEALESPAFYVGALGSERTSAHRRARLAELDIPQEAIARLHAPVGISIGSKTPPEIAISILAQLTQLRRRMEDGQFSEVSSPCKVSCASPS